MKLFVVVVMIVEQQGIQHFAYATDII